MLIEFANTYTYFLFPVGIDPHPHLPPEGKESYTSFPPWGKQERGFLFENKLDSV